MANTDCILTSNPKPTAAADQGTSDLPHTPAIDFANPVCLGGKFVIHITQGMRCKLALNLIDRTGTTVDLTSIQDNVIVTGPNDTVPEPPPTKYEARFMAEEALSALTLSINVPGTITDFEKGKVEVELSATDTARAGIFHAQLGIFDNSNSLLQATPYWLCVEPNLSHYNPTGPISIAEVRLILRDVCPEQNFLIDDVEFSDTEIAYCITRPVDEFNEKYQPKTQFTPSTFPFRFHWASATAGYLMRMAATSYARNHLDYGVSGAQIQLQNKVKIYTELSEMLLKEWRDFVKNTKLEMNIENAWGTQRSTYVRRWWIFIPFILPIIGLLC